MIRSHDSWASLKLRLELFSHMHNASILIFAACGEMENARKVFDVSPVKDLESKIFCGLLDYDCQNS